MKNTSEAIVNLIITIDPAPSGGGNAYIDGKKVLGGKGTIKYPVQNGAHAASFDFTGNPGENYRLLIVKEQGPVLWDAHGTLSQQGTINGQNNIQV